MQLFKRTFSDKVIVSNEGVDDIMKIVKSLVESSLLVKVIMETIEKWIKKQKGEFSAILLGLLAAVFLPTLLSKI